MKIATIDSQAKYNTTFKGLNINNLCNNGSKLTNSLIENFSKPKTQKSIKFLPLAIIPLIVGLINKNSKPKKELPLIEEPIIVANKYDDRTIDLLTKLKDEGVNIDITGGIDRHKAGGLTDIDKKLLKNEINDALKQGKITSDIAKDRINEISFCGNQNLATTASVPAAVPATTAAASSTLESAFDMAGDIQTVGGIIHNTKRVIDGIENNDKKTIAKGAVGLVDNTVGVAARETAIGAATAVASGIGGSIGGAVEGLLTNGKSTKNGEKIGAIVAATVTQAVARVEWGKIRDKVVDKVTDYVESPEGQEKITQIKETGKKVANEVSETAKNIKEETTKLISDIKDSETYKNAVEQAKEVGKKFLSFFS